MNRAAFFLSWLLVGVATGVALHVGGRDEEPDASGPARSPGDDTFAPDTASGPGPGTSSTPFHAPPHSYHDGIMRVAPSVVSLYARVDDDALDEDSAIDPASDTDGNGARTRLSQGSGVMVDPEGIVLTNLHLVEGANAINVVLADGTPHIGRLVGSDRETDLAVVRIGSSNEPSPGASSPGNPTVHPPGERTPVGGFAAVPLGDAPPLRVGDVVLAIGNPFGVGQTVTQGIVSATRRRIAGGSAWQDFVQIDAAINPGNSGGALINPAGQLVGVTTAVFRGGPAQGIGFAIPAELLARVVPDIIADGRVVRGWLGAGVDDLPMFPELHRRLDRGAVVTSVLPDGPAAEGGLARLDVVTSVDGQDIADATALLLLISSLDPGTDIRLEVARGEVTRELLVRLGERPPLYTNSPR